MVLINGIPHLKTSEVAERLSVSLKTVRNWAYSGRLTSIHRAGVRESLFALPEVEKLEQGAPGKGSRLKPR